MRTTEIRALTVSDYASRIGAAVRNVGAAVIEGEVQRPHTSRGGLLYFDLTDGEAKLCCKVFRRDVAALQHTPNAGDLVQVQVDRPDLWSVAGKLDLIVSGVKLAGEGELLRRRAALIDQLTREGLCDPARWKPLPTFPRAVGVIAGKGSDGRSDVIRALQDRFPPTRIVCCDAVVQGKSAPRDIIDAIAHLQHHPLVDVVVIARGGGSVQDLIAFDDERLSRAVFACDVPVVTAIGHTGNTPVCNHITHAASTPSRSAELVVPSAAELRQGIVYAQQVINCIPMRVEQRSERLEALRERWGVPELIEDRRRDVRELGQRVARTEEAFFSVRERRLSEARSVIETIPHRARVKVAERERGLAAERPRLAAAPVRIDAVAADVASAGERGRMGIKRELEDHEHDFGRAIARLIRETRIGIDRSFSNEHERITRARSLVRERVDRRVDGADRELRHTAALIEARDLRRCGFVLAGDEEGRPIASVAGLSPGDRVHLNFRDGQAEVVVDTTKEEGS